ncbi:MAG TPA: tetratricopeptide repeat protein [Longimicrobium sp.]|nr:tetratricopeptide repeat protein [Longimicrobium sp.]
MRRRLSFLLLALALGPLSAAAQEREDMSASGSEGAGPTPAEQAATQTAATGYTLPDPLVQAVQEMEAKGDLFAAREALENALAGVDSPSAAAGAHLGELQRATDALTTARLYEADGLHQEALSSLPKPGDFTDPDIRLVVARRVRELGLRVGRAGLAQARAQKDTAPANRLYARLAGDTLRIPAEIRDAAQRALDSIAGPLRASLRDTANASFMATLGEQAREATAGVVKIGIFLGMLALLIGGGLLLRTVLGPRDGMSLNLEDLTDPDAAPEDRDKKSHLLLREIARDLRALERAAGTSMGEKAEDLDGVANLRIEATLLDELKDSLDGDPVQVGWIRLSPKQVLGLLTIVGNRPYRTQLRGHLSTGTDDTALLFVERYDLQRERFKPWREVKQSQFYREVGTGADARRQAIRKFATRYLYDCAERKPARTFESFRDYLAALEELDRPATSDRDRLSKGRTLLESAVYQDPDNWQARIKLAEVLRKQGDYDGALRHFHAVRNLVGDRNPPASLKAETDKSPEFSLVLDYNLALTRSLGLNHEDQTEAIREFDALLADIEAKGAPAGAPPPPPPPGPPPAPPATPAGTVPVETTPVLEAV